MTTDYGTQAAESIEGPFLGVARRHSLCDDDAWEALAHGFEIAMRHRARIRPDTAPAWFATVVRHEAMRIRRGRCRDLHLDPAVHEPPASEPEREADPRLPALRAAMRQLKPDERRALILFYAMDASRVDGGLPPHHELISGHMRQRRGDGGLGPRRHVADDAAALPLLPPSDSAAIRPRSES